jgi:hypothetical protein
MQKNINKIRQLFVGKYINGVSVEAIDICEEFDYVVFLSQQIRATNMKKWDWMARLLKNYFNIVDVTVWLVYDANTFNVLAVDHPVVEVNWHVFAT